MGRPVRPSKLAGESDESDSMCTEVWHDPSSSRQGREPPGRHLSSTRFQNALSTEVEAALASLLGFTSEQPDGGRSHCGTPGSCATALVPEGASRCRVHKELVCESGGSRFESEDSRLIRRPCRCGEPEGCAVHATGVGGMLLRRAACEPKFAGNPKTAWRKLVSPRKREVHAA